MNELKRQSEPSIERRSAGSFTVGDYLFGGVILLICGLWVYTRLLAPTSVEDQASSLSMPSRVQRQNERQLYLTPGGIYSLEDITANEGLTVSEKYIGLKVTHDLNPLPGDRLCPITRTKANPECSWIINGHRYTFCCPPCIDEFVAMAKQQAEEVQPPDVYVK